MIDWLIGRARGFDPQGRRTRATWATGAVGMTGVSYDGTLANQVATTGVEGLRTIIPVAAISSWYDYYRANGLVVAPHSETGGAGDNEYLGEDTDVIADFITPRMADRCAHVRRRLVARQDRDTGDYTRFWKQRDYVRRARRVRASVFVVHGRNDWNVRPKAFAAWWSRLVVPRKLWLHIGGHGGPAGAAYRRAEHRWFDRWLFNVPNGIDGEPRLTIQREDNSYHDEADWPAPGTTTARLYPSADGSLAAQPAAGPRQSFLDRGRRRDTDRELLARPGRDDPNRLLYVSSALAADVRLSGTPWVDLWMSIANRGTANLTAVLVDYGGGRPVMVTRGWLDPRNRDGIARSRPLRRGREYRLRWDLQPDDYIWRAGHRIGLVVVSTDHDYTLRPRPGTRLTLNPSGSELQLPVVGGVAVTARRPRSG